MNYNLRRASTRLKLPSFNLEYMYKSWSYLTTSFGMVYPLELGVSSLGRSQARVAFVYGAALTLRDCYGSGVAGLDTDVLSHSIPMNF